MLRIFALPPAIAFIPFGDNAPALKQVRAFVRLAFVEACGSQFMNVERCGFAVDDYFGEQLAERGRVHDAVAGGAVGEVEVLKPFGAAEERVPVGRHLVEPGPTSAALDFDALQTRHALARTPDDFGDPLVFDARVEGVAVARLVGPEQKHAPVAHAQVKAVADEYRHRHLFGQKLARPRHRDLSAQRRDGNFAPCHTPDLSRPRARRVHERRRRELAARSHHRLNRPALTLAKTFALDAALEAHAEARRGLRVPAKDFERAYEAVRGAVDAARHALRVDRRIQTRDI